MISIAFAGQAIDIYKRSKISFATLSNNEYEIRIINLKRKNKPYEYSEIFSSQYEALVIYVQIKNMIHSFSS